MMLNIDGLLQLPMYSQFKAILQFKLKEVLWLDCILKKMLQNIVNMNN